MAALTGGIDWSRAIALVTALWGVSIGAQGLADFGKEKGK